MEEALIAKLLGTSGIASLAGTRIYPVSRPQGTTLPAVTLSRISGAPIYADDGETGLAEARAQIDCWGRTYADTKGLARAVIASLSAFFGEVDGVDFQYILLDSERDFREGGGNAAEYLFRTQLDFQVWYKS